MASITTSPTNSRGAKLEQQTSPTAYVGRTFARRIETGRPRRDAELAHMSVASVGVGRRLLATSATSSGRRRTKTAAESVFSAAAGTIAMPKNASQLFVEPDVFVACAVINRVDLRNDALHVRLPACRKAAVIDDGASDIGNQLLLYVDDHRVALGTVRFH